MAGLLYPRLYTADEASHSPHVLATRELLRPPVQRTRRTLEPFTRAWYEELEMKRYLRQGAWLPRWLEFSRHSGESLLMLGPGLGTDALQYHRHGTEVTLALGPDDDDEHLCDHLRLRGLELPVVSAPDSAHLPMAAGRFDLVYWNALHTSIDLAAVSEELYRVLKPGGKLFALFPARIDVDRWQRWLLPLRRLYRDREPRPTSAHKRTGHELHEALAKFSERRVRKRLLRRSELPHVWRWLPLNMMERLMGRVLAVRAFKPVNATAITLAAAA